MPFETPAKAMGKSELDFFAERCQTPGPFSSVSDRHDPSYNKINQLTKNSALVSSMNRSELQKYCAEKGLPITGKTEDVRNRAAARALEGTPERTSKLPTLNPPNLTEERWWPTIRHNQADVSAKNLQ